MRSALSPVVAFMAAMSLGSDGASAQASPQVADRMNIAVILVPSLDHPTATAKVVRRREGSPQNLIFCTREATAADLVRAIIAVAGSQQRHGTSLGGNLVSFVGRGEPSTGRARPTRVGEARAILARLRTTRWQIDIPGLGPSQAVILSAAVSDWAG